MLLLISIGLSMIRCNGVLAVKLSAQPPRAGGAACTRRWSPGSPRSPPDTFLGYVPIPTFCSNHGQTPILNKITKTAISNVRNTGLIDNLPDGCVEVACLVDQNGVQPCHFGALLEQLAGWNRTHMTVHTLVCDALLNREKEAARYVLMLDPLTAAVCSPAEISALFDEMWEAQLPYLQYFEC
ncbi:MAG: hypothetical protein AUH05_10910 [Ktedonobacter sp. 13_2_20CM_53_11]|nr:MAG: hypothetical protein AUH05_10910 [Ktedonobacter sp. 13_2_20CM_53_11]